MSETPDYLIPGYTEAELDDIAWGFHFLIIDTLFWKKKMGDSFSERIGGRLITDQVEKLED